MKYSLGIRREDKNKWERRVPLTPEYVNKLKKEHDIETHIQPSRQRVFTDEEYKKAGAKVKEDLSSCETIFAVKEISINFFESGKTYVFFAHVIKGQEYNMPMLKEMMKLGCNLIDYEKVTDDNGRRLIFFGRFAGIAGIVDSLWAYGNRLKIKGIQNPFSEVKKTIEYRDLDELKKHIKKIGRIIGEDGLPDEISPFVIGIAGYGNVSMGVQEIIDLLPVETINPENISVIRNDFSSNKIYKVVFKEKHMVKPISPRHCFDLKEYYSKPDLYESVFFRYIDDISILMNCIYWESKYPRLITKNFIKDFFSNEMKLQVIGDISADVNGAIEFTEKPTTPGNPVFVYNPLKDEIYDGLNEEGVVVMAVDNLPCELPRESSINFSRSLINFVPDIVKTDFSVDFEELKMPSEIKKAVILFNGELTPNYEYINKFL